MNNTDFRKKHIDPELARYAGVIWKNLCKKLPDSKVKIRFYPGKTWKLIGTLSGDRVVPKKAYVSGRLQVYICDDNQVPLKEYNIHLSGKIVFTGKIPKVVWKQPVSATDILTELTRC